MTIRIISGILAVVVVVVGILYGLEVGKVNKANDNVANLEGQLSSEQVHAANLQSQLTAANANVTSLTTDLAVANTKVSSLTADLATANTKVTGITADLATANAKITSLTADLATANARVTNLTADLATANAKVTSITADLATANARITSLTANLATANANLVIASDNASSLNTELRKVKDPRHFNSRTELQTWLDADNTNIIYSATTSLQYAYILQVKALRDGFLLPMFFEFVSGTFSSGNSAYITGGSANGTNAIFVIPAYSDSPFQRTSGGATIPSHPLPLP